MDKYSYYVYIYFQIVHMVSFKYFSIFCHYKKIKKPFKMKKESQKKELFESQ